LNQTRNRRPYFTMKLVKGQTLTTLLKERPAGQHELPRFLGIFAQVCQTVAYAHARGVIHRDLKPSNIMVGAFGEIQVMDWGLAKVLKRDSGGDAPPDEATVIRTVRSDEHSRASRTPTPASGSHTAAGSILGTPAYMAPEQARGEVDSLDERCDVFGLGAILCQILTGQPPYPSTGRLEMGQPARQAELDAALARLDGCGADGALITLAKQCLQANKEDRPRDAGVLAQTMTAYLESVQARLKQAELDRAAAQARAEEEQKRRQVEQARANAERQGRQAEQARADEESRRRQAEQARADEEQKRRQAEQAQAQTERQWRRLAVALAAAVVVLVAGAGAAGWWYQQDQLDQAQKQAQLDAEEATRQAETAAKQAKLDAEEAARQAEAATRKEYLHKEVSTALKSAELGLKELQQALTTLPSENAPALTVSVLLSDLKQWESRVQTVKAHWQQAKKLAESSPALLPPEQLARLQQLGALIKIAEADYQVGQQLDNIRLDASTPVEGNFNTAQAGPKYETLFLDKLGLNLRSGPVAALASQVKGSTLRYVLVAALDHWAKVTPDKDLLPRLLEVARTADSDPWRDQVRNPNTWHDLGQLQQLAKDVKPQQQTPPILILLEQRLYLAGAKQEAAALLRTALVHHPADFWLNFHLGNLADDPGEKAGCFRAAVAIRPGNSAAHSNLGMALAAKKDLEGAIQEFKKAIELDPQAALPHHGLGLALHDKNDLDGAIKEYHKAIALDSKIPQTHNNLGAALSAKKDPDGAIKEYQKAIELDPKYSVAYNNLGAALGKKRDLDGAIQAFKKAIALDPKFIQAHYNLGAAYGKQGSAWLKQGQFAQAKEALLQALKPFPPGHPNHKAGQDALAKCEQGLLALEQKLTAVLQGPAQPKDGLEQLALADLCWRDKKLYATAVRFYASGLAEQPALAKLHRYHAACAAVLAAAGQGKDGDKLDAKGKAKLRQQALTWLQEELDFWKAKSKGDPLVTQELVNKLSQWQADPDLVSVRDDKALAQLPEAERQDWQMLWADVVELLQKANN
jgi:Flp pilus assembly protein TadD